MTMPTETSFIRDTGVCYWGPTSYGNLGTELGYVSEGLSLMPNYIVTPVTSELTGLTPQMLIYSGMAIMIRTRLMNVTTNTLKRALFQAGGTLDVTIPGTSILTGTDLFTVSNAGNLLFVPNNSAYHPAIYATGCVGMLLGNSAVKIHYRQVTDLDVAFFCKSVRTALLATIFPPS